MTPPRRRLDVNLEELDRVLDGARESPLSEADCEKVKTALHALAAMLVRPRNTEKTKAVLLVEATPLQDSIWWRESSLVPQARAPAQWLRSAVEWGLERADVPQAGHAPAPQAG